MASADLLGNFAQYLLTFKRRQLACNFKATHCRCDCRFNLLWAGKCGYANNFLIVRRAYLDGATFGTKLPVEKVAGVLDRSQGVWHGYLPTIFFNNITPRLIPQVTASVRLEPPRLPKLQLI